MKPRLLVIPHIYAENIAVREIELARRLTVQFEVFILKWANPLNVEARSGITRRFTQVRTAVGAALRTTTTRAAKDGTCVVDVPVWQPLLFQRLVGGNTALSFCKLLNRGTLRELLRDFKITHLLLANELFGVERIPQVHSYYDIVDWFPEEKVPAGELARIRTGVRKIGEEVDGVFAVSEPLCEKLRRDCGLRAMALPNGADIESLRGVAAEETAALRARLGIANSFVIGYIGNHGSYTGVDLVVSAFVAARARMPDAKLLIVGPAEIWSELLQSHRDAGVIATGNIAPGEIAEYFNAIDVGVLAQGKTSGTDFAFQIKVVEYSACRKCVVSTPLETWRRLAWPNVILAEPDTQSWADAFVAARSMRWEPEWDHVVDEYDWQVLAQKAANVMLGHSDGAVS